MPPRLPKGAQSTRRCTPWWCRGLGRLKRQAEEEGLDRIFKDAGFDWREAGCSMCLGMNPDILQPGERCASTSNRNFEGRQGKGGRTHLVSPAMAAAAAITGHFVDIREGSRRTRTESSFWNSDEGGHAVFVPTASAWMHQRRRPREEALGNIREAIELHMELTTTSHQRKVRGCFATTVR